MIQNKKAIGNRIKTIRKNLGLTLEQFGSLIDDSSKSNVSKWESGVSIPNNKRLKLISTLGKVSVNELLYGSLDDFADDLLKELRESLKNDISVEQPLIEPIMKQVNLYLYPTTDEPLELRFNDINDLKQKFEWYANKSIEEWKSPESREINIIKSLQHDINKDFDNSIRYMYKSTYKNSDNAFLTLGIEDGMNEDLYNELIKMQSDIFENFSKLTEKYEN